MQFLILFLIVVALLWISVFPELYANILKMVFEAKRRIKDVNKETK